MGAAILENQPGDNVPNADAQDPPPPDLYQEQGKSELPAEEKCVGFQLLHRNVQRFRVGLVFKAHINKSEETQDDF